MVSTVQRPAENKMSFLRCIQFEHKVSLQPHAPGWALLHREKVAFPMTFYGIIKTIFISQASTGLLWSPFSVLLSLRNLSLFLSPGEAEAFSSLTGWWTLLGLPCSGCLQAKQFSSPLWVMDVHLPLLPSLFFLIMSVLFRGQAHCPASEHSVISQVSTTFWGTAVLY